MEIYINCFEKNLQLRSALWNLEIFKRCLGIYDRIAISTFHTLVSSNKDLKQLK